jgi:hypothetical protein
MIFLLWVTFTGNWKYCSANFCELQVCAYKTRSMAVSKTIFLLVTSSKLSPQMTIDLSCISSRFSNTSQPLVASSYGQSTPATRPRYFRWRHNIAKVQKEQTRSKNLWRRYINTNIIVTHIINCRQRLGEHTPEVCPQQQQDMQC